MGIQAPVETRRDRKELVADAGFKRLSLISVVAGALCAYGAFALLAGIAVGVVGAADFDFDVASQWQDLGVGGGLVVAGLLLLAYLFGGYVAGRMARRSGTLHGAAVFVLGVALAAGAAALARLLGGDDVAANNLRDLGVPTTGSEWGDIATLAGVASLAAMLVGGLLGGALGERWHSKLLARALDPRVGAEAAALRDAERRAAEAERRAADADERRTGSFERVRATTPVRTRRVDNGDDYADTRPDGRYEDHDDTRVVGTPNPTGGTLLARSNDDDRDRDTAGGPSFWKRHRRPEPERVSTVRSTGPSDGRTA